MGLLDPTPPPYDPIAWQQRPLDERGRRRAAARAEWFSQADKPLEVHDIVGE